MIQQDKIVGYNELDVRHNDILWTYIWYVTIPGNEVEPVILDDVLEVTAKANSAIDEVKIRLLYDFEIKRYGIDRIEINEG